MQTIKILKTLWKVIKIAILASLILSFAALILFVLFIAFLFSPLNTDFSYIENKNLAKFEALTNMKGETLLIYRKKVLLYRVVKKYRLVSVTRIL